MDGRVASGWTAERHDLTTPAIGTTEVHGVAVAIPLRLDDLRSSHIYALALRCPEEQSGAARPIQSESIILRFGVAARCEERERQHHGHGSHRRIMPGITRRKPAGCGGARRGVLMTQDRLSSAGRRHELALAAAVRPHREVRGRSLDFGHDLALV
jgi:hypothetical protein